MNTKTYFTLLLAFVILGISCKKETEYDFIVYGRVPPGFLSTDKKNYLVFSDSKGTVLDAFEILPNELEFQRGTKVKEGIKSIHVHLGIRYGSNPTQIYSHLDVQNGEAIAFQASWFGIDGSQIEQRSVVMHGIQSLDSLGILGNTLYTTYDPSTDFAATSTHVFPNQGIVVHARANGALNYRYKYFSDSIVHDAPGVLHIDWDQLIPVSSFKHITFGQDLPPARELNVDAISSDLNSFVSIGPGRHIDSLDVQFLQPEEVPKTLRIQLRGDNYFIERLFQPGEDLNFDMTDMSIGKISSTPGKGFNIQTSGDIDLLEVNCNESTYYAWTIQGEPSSFEDATLPTLFDLSKYINLPNAYPTPFWRFTVRAHQFGKHNYPEIKEGFPYRSAEKFSVARSGYFRLEKWFE